MSVIRQRLGNMASESAGANRIPLGVAAGPRSGEPRPVDPLEGTQRRAMARIIPLDRIMADDERPQPRTEEGFDPDRLRELADSLLDEGQLQAILVRWSVKHEKYLIISGERRFRAAKLAGLKTINADVTEDEDPVSIHITQLVENCQREDLTPMEEARAFHNLMTADSSRFKTAASLAAKLKMSESSISRALKLLKLPEQVQEMVDSEKLSAATAYEVSKAPAAHRTEIADRVVNEGLTVLETAKVVSEIKEQAVDQDESTSVGSSASIGQDSDRLTTTKTKTKAKSKVKLPTSRKYKGQGGLVIMAERSKGLDLLVLVEALRAFADQVEAETVS